MKLSNNFSLNEMTKSQTATRKGISNNPSEDHMNNLKELCVNVLQRVRDHFGRVVSVSSGYRSPALNEAIGGSPRSFHSHGMALDLDQDGRNKGVSNADVFFFIKENLPFSELIWEFGNEDNPNWVHVAIAKGRENEKKIKIAEKINGKTQYKIWDRD